MPISRKRSPARTVSSIPVKPAYGFCMMIDVSGAGVTAQEVTVGLLKERIAAIPGDGLGNVKAADYLRLNYSHPDIACFERFREALPKAIAEAQAGLYAEAVIAFFERGRGRSAARPSSTRSDRGSRC